MLVYQRVTSAPPLLGPQLVLSGVVALGSKDTGRHHLRSGTSLRKNLGLANLFLVL